MYSLQKDGLELSETKPRKLVTGSSEDACTLQKANGAAQRGARRKQRAEEHRVCKAVLFLRDCEASERSRWMSWKTEVPHHLSLLFTPAGGSDAPVEK